MIYFPPVQSALYTQLTRSLQADPSGLDAPQALVSSAETGEIARIVLRSSSAAQFALTQVQDQIGGRSESVAGLRKHLSIETVGAATLELRFESKSPSASRAYLQGLLDYYKVFIAKNPLTRVQLARESLDDRLVTSAKQLRKFEEAMSRSKFTDLRSLGDSAIKADPKLMAQIWMRRADEQNQTRDILNKLQKIRGTEQGQIAKDPWLAKWAGNREGARISPSKALALPVRRQDLLERAKLEREYSEALLLHRSLVLQRSFLLTWEKLDNSEFQLVEPIEVVPVERSYLYSAGLGLLVGLLVWGMRQLSTSGKRK